MPPRPGEQRAPQVRPGLAEALHVDVHLDVRPQDGHRRHPAHHRQAPLPGAGQRHQVRERGAGERDRRLGGAVQRREPRHGGDPRGPQRGGGVAAHDQADVLLALQLRLAGGPPRAAAALHDPGRAGERGGPGGRRRGDGDPVGEPGVVLRERAVLAGPVAAGEVVPDDDVRVEPDHAAVPAERLAGRGRPARGLQHPVQVGQPQQVAGLRAGLACGVRGGPPRIGRRQGRRQGASARVRDPVPHDDHRHVAAAGQAHQQLGATPTGAAHPVRQRAGRGPGQDRVPDERRPGGDRGGSGTHPVHRVRRHRMPRLPGRGGEQRADPHPVLGGVGPPLGRRRVGQRPRGGHRRRIVVEVDAAAAVRGDRGVEHHPRGPRTGHPRRRVVRGGGHGSEGSDHPRQFRRRATRTTPRSHPRNPTSPPRQPRESVQSGPRMSRSGTAAERPRSSHSRARTYRLARTPGAPGGVDGQRSGMIGSRGAGGALS